MVQPVQGVLTRTDKTLLVLVFTLAMNSAECTETVYYAHYKVLYVHKHGTESVANSAMVEIVASKLTGSRFDPQRCKVIFIIFSIFLRLVPTLLTSGAVKRISYKTAESPIYNVSYTMFIYEPM